MLNSGFFVRCIWILIVLQFGHSNLHVKFRDFQEMKPDNFTVVVKRDTSSGRIRLKLVSFHALKKHFVMFLSPGTPVLSKDYEANTVDSNGSVAPFRINRNIFYTGYINGNPQHGVDAVHVDELWIAQIYATDDIYSIEPMTHHELNSPATSMLIFRHRDINSSVYDNKVAEKDGLHPFCEEVQFPANNPVDSTSVRQNDDDYVVYQNNTIKIGKHRKESINNNKNMFRSMRFAERLNMRTLQSQRYFFRNEYLKRKQTRWQRTTPVYDTCDMYTIVDFEFYKGLAKSNFFRAAALVIHLYQAADRIFRETYFEDLTNLGINVAKMTIHTSYTNEAIHYNMAKNVMTGTATLRFMTTVTNFTNYCLVHLSTQRNFGGTLGLAATAELKSIGWSNGICARQHNEARNVGLSTIKNAYNNIIPLITYILVITHEIGHNWGSHHDPVDDLQCSPQWENGGKFIMWSYSGQTSGANAKRFSSCSRQEIGMVLQGKAHACFMPQAVVQSFCGNSVIDYGEDCDVGYQTKDDCCGANCRFKSGAICSPLNHPCCTSSCQIASSTELCHVIPKTDCYETPRCSGTKFDLCQQSKPMPNNSTCEELGRCWYGNCVPFCQLTGISLRPTRRLESCNCESDRRSMCMHCCWDPDVAGVCKVMGGPFSNGSICLLGYCKDGVCVSTEKDDNINLYDNSASSTSQQNCAVNYNMLVFLEFVALSKFH